VSAADLRDGFRLDWNCVRVRGEPQVRVYFAQLRRALDALEQALSAETPIANAERRAVAGFLRRLRATFDALALKYFFPAPGAELKLDVTDSGFFHWSELLELAADLAGRDAELSRLPGPEELKRGMLDAIVRYSLHPREHQAALLRRLYLEAVRPEALFRPFVPGALEKVGGPEDASSWFWSFATYDRACNRPFVHSIYFEWEGESLAEGSEEWAEVRAAAERAAAGRLSLLAFASLFDADLPRLRPRIVKRLVLGPYASPLFTQNEGPWAALFESLEERLPFALRFETEILISEREARVGAGWLSKGQLRQVFWIPDSVELATRGVSQLERCVILPQWLAQRAQGAGLLSDHRCIVIEEPAQA
jgi:hypothetical protein